MANAKQKPKPKLTRKQRETGYMPGSFGWHEIVERSLVSAENFTSNVSEHPAANHPALRIRINRIERDLHELYRIAATEE